ncbi:Pao retrotransposon peptidase [Trichostrongylus colubriformis]|uniref:Pao retrotransposon peptidase n=1 Tax=Trichostrongylus colubriformis TaxID=6319 RepID=A0AAN8IPI5_TRICO
MVADIQKAFLQIRLPEEHRDVTRFLWVKDPTLPPTGSNLKYFRFCRVPFGINASPAILNQSILKHIEESQSEIVSELSNSLYVDNVLLEGRNAKDLIRKYTESKRLFASIGMNLRDYLSNSVSVNNSIEEPDRAKSTEIKVLGIHWNAIKDTITLQCITKHFNKISKRTVLSQINGYCYDPLGLLSPLMTPAKIFLQDLHKKKYGWDDSLSEEDTNTWKSIMADIDGFEVTLPRKVVEKDGTTKHTLSIFVDSSKRAYACCIYVTTASATGVKETKLFTAKSKIAPIKKEQTIPRLELLSIFIGLSLAESTINKIDVTFEQINVFSDSTIALCWIQGYKRLPSIVTTLVQKIGLITRRIRECSNVTFYHVPTHENTADCATRGVSKNNFNSHRWWSGPVLLNMSPENWPVKDATNLREQSDDEEAEACYHASASTVQVRHPVWSLESTNDYSKVIRVTAYCARFIRNATKGKCLSLKNKALVTITPSAEKAILAEQLLIRQEQATFKSEELKRTYHRSSSVFIVMSCESTQSSSEGPIEDLLDLDITSAEALMTNIHDCSTKKRLSRKQRQKRAAEPSDNTHNTEPPKKIAALTNAPKMTLRPLLISHDDKGVMSNKDIRDIFYAVMDGITDIKKKQDRLEDRLRILDTRTAVFEAWLKRFEPK